MNAGVEIHSSSSSSSDSESVGSIAARNDRRSITSSEDSYKEKPNSTRSSTSSHSIDKLQAVEEAGYTRETNSKSSHSSNSTADNSIRDNVEGSAKPYGDPLHSGSEYSSEKRNAKTPSIATESDKYLLRSILSDSSSDKISTDIEVTSPKEGKFSSSTDEELLRKFREQQATRRYRPKSAKYKRDVEPEPETVQKFQAPTSNKGSTSTSDSTDSSADERSNSVKRKLTVKKRSRRRPTSSASNSSGQKKVQRSRSSSTSSGSIEVKDKSFRKDQQSTRSSSLSSASTLTSDKEVAVRRKTAKPDRILLENSRNSSDLRNHVRKSREDYERPPSRQERRREPQQNARVGRPRTRSTPEKYSADQVLRKKSKPLSTSSRDNWPKEPGFWWPYKEDCNEKELRRLISYHRRKLKNLLAQEYLQRHLEIELRRTGAQFKRYDRAPQSITPKQIRKYKERDVSWIYLDGNLYNLKKDSMGIFMTKDKSDRQNKVLPKKNRKGSGSMERSSKSSERSKRSVSFEKGSGGRSTVKKSSSKLAKGKKKQRSRSSSKDSRRSSLSSRGSSRVSRNSSKSSEVGDGRGATSESRSRSHSRSSSRSSKRSSSGSKAKKGYPARPKTALSRPKTAKPKLRSLSSASRSSAEVSGKKKAKCRSSSNSGTDHRSKSRESSHKGKNNSHLERVLFTEEFEKHLKRKERKSKKQKNEYPQIEKSRPSKAELHVKEKPKQSKTDPQLPIPKQRAPRDDYNFYRDPNIPGHAFPQYYLAQLLSTQTSGRRKQNETTQYVLLPSPVNRSPPWKSYPSRSGRSRRKTLTASARMASPPKSKRKKTKSIINQPNKMERSSSRESSSSSSRRSSPVIASHPRIRPGSGPIKCSWKSRDDSDKPKYEGSDHQLKNTDNPAILSWLKRKDAQLRARRHDEVRSQRRKTEKLIDEQNDLDDKHERALRQYEVWKKNKDREILLRRRKEAREANSASFNREDDGLTHTSRTSHSAQSHQNYSGGSTFSELRSSSARPETAEEKVIQRKARPKSANTIGVSLGTRDAKQRPKSATPTRVRGEKEQDGPFQPTQSLFKSFLREDKSSGQTNNESISENIEGNNEATSEKSKPNGNRYVYNKWVRSSPSPSKKNKNRRSKKKNAAKHLPAHNHTDNELISNLAKRRIDSILASKKRVNTGLKKRPASGTVRSGTAPQPTASDPTHRKWKLREDDVIKPTVTFAADKKSSTSSSSSSKSDEERTKFSYRKKSPKGSAQHHRNPVLREAVNSSDTSSRT